MHKSKCCNANIRFAISPDFIGDDPKKMRVGTCSFECEKCGNPCDTDTDPIIATKTNETSNDWLLKITKVDNGYLLCGNPDNSLWVIEDSEKDELRSGENLLWEIMNYFNFGGSKHDKIRLKITRVKQKG